MKTSYIKKQRKVSKNPDKHIPNQKESEAIRKACAETGRSEDDLRRDYHYRKLFAEASKVKILDHDEKIDKYYKRICQLARKKSGFGNSHENSIKELEVYLKRKNPKGYSIESVLSKYGKS